MSQILSAQGLGFRTAWLDLPLTRWDLLLPSWKGRAQYLEAQNQFLAYQRDAFLHWARDFLVLQGVVGFSPEAWLAYERSGHALWSLPASGVFPSPEAAHQAVQGLATAMALLHKQAQASQPLESEGFIDLLQKGLGAKVALRQEPHNGPLPLRAISPAEVEKAFSALLSEVENQLKAGVSPIAVAAWAHHALSQIRPFADGNARAAFLLTQYILWRGEIPGWYLKPTQRVAYYQALHEADKGALQLWGDLFLTGIQQALLTALSWEHPPLGNLEENIQVFNQRFSDWRSRHSRERSQRIMNHRYMVFDYVEEILRKIANELDEKLKVEEGRGTRALVAKAYPDSPYYYQFTTDIIEYARRHGYYFNRGLPRGWFKLKFSLSANKKYQLVFSLHHAGHDDSTLVIGAFLHFLEPLKYQQKRARRRRSPRRREKAIYLFAPLPFPSTPLAFSIEKDPQPAWNLLDAYIQQHVVQAIGLLANEIY
ncbi:MAG: Fic family protein [Bacteroidia bacterium]|nr:Fic family protein [Bacteroidia bacterium]MDW8088437.1 Fic family protein [Bacteroidia bacterium]